MFDTDYTDEMGGPVAVLPATTAAANQRPRIQGTRAAAAVSPTRPSYGTGSAGDDDFIVICPSPCRQTAS